MNDAEQSSKERDLKCDFIIVSAVKKLIHSKERRCAPEFLEALDAAVSALVRKSCEAHNGGAKTLDAAVLSAGSTAKPVEPTGLRAAYDEVICLELQINVMDKKEFIKRVRSIKSILEAQMEAK